MNIGKKNSIIQNVQGNFYNYISIMSKGLSRSEKKFLKDIVRGILLSKTPIIRRAAQELKEDISIKKTRKRFIYHLDKKELTEKLENNQLTYLCHNTDINDLFIVDKSDICKKYSKKQEGLSRVRDGNSGKLVNGYETINIMSVKKKYGEVTNKDKEEYELRILASKLYSNKKEIDTSKQIIFDTMINIIIASNNKGVFVFDREFDDKHIYRFFRDNESSFIIRSMGKRDLYYKGEKIGFKKLVRKVKLSHYFNVKEEQFRAGIIDVEIPLDPHPRKKNSDLFPAKLFVGKYNNGGYWYILFSLPNHKNLSKKELTEFVFNSYGFRWKIEEYHRHIKKEYRWEDIQLGTYQRLKALNVILSIVANFIYKMGSLKYHFISAFQHLMIDVKRKIDKIPKFFYYRISSVIRECFLELKRYKKIKYKITSSKVIQYTLPFY